MRRTRLLLVMHEMSLSGAPRLALSSFRRLHDETDIHIVSEHGGPLEANFRALGHTTVLRQGPLATISQRIAGSQTGVTAIEGLTGRIRSRFVLMRPRKWRPDVVYVSSVAALPILARMPWVRRLNAPTILHVHEAEIALWRYEAAVPGLMATMADRYVAVSESVASALVRLGIDQARVVVIPPHVDDRWLHAGTMGTDMEFDGHDERPIVVGGAGAPNWTKGVELWLLTASELVRRHGPDRYRFVWVGVRDDHSSVSFRAMVAKLHLEGVVELMPETPDPLPAFSKMDVLIVSSWEESASLVTLEMMAMGKVVACFRGSGGPAEELGDAGIIIDEFSPKGMADSIADVADSPGWRLDIGRMARARIQEQYTAAVQIPKILREIRSLIDR